MPAAMVQLISCGNIFVLIISSRICAAPVSWTRPAVQGVARVTRFEAGRLFVLKPKLGADM